MEQIEPRPRAERTPSSVDITIDIKPRIFPNYINLMSKRVIPVAILTTEEFDITAVNPETVVFAGASPLCWALKDTDDYDDIDMILHFKTQDADIERVDSEVTITSQTCDGKGFFVTDSVRTVSKQKWVGHQPEEIRD